MPSLIIYFDSNLNNKIQKMDLTKIDDIFIKIIIKTLKAEEEKCQILWIDSKINMVNSNISRYTGPRFFFIYD